MICHHAAGRRPDARTANHAALRWMASNLAVIQDPAGNLKPAKNKSKDRIDGIVALIMAIARSIVQPKEERSTYETEGLFIINS